MNIKELAQRLSAVRAELTEANRTANALKAEKEALESDLLDAIQSAGMESVKVDGTTFGISVKQKPIVEDWDAYYGYILKTGNVQLLYKQATQSVIMELLEAGEPVPGVAVVEEPKIYYR
jgi:hypothetical protein